MDVKNIFIITMNLVLDYVPLAIQGNKIVISMGHILAESYDIYINNEVGLLVLVPSPPAVEIFNSYNSYSKNTKIFLKICKYQYSYQP